MSAPYTLDTDLLPDDTDVAFYREHGYWLSPPVLPESVLDDAAAGMARLYAGQADRRLPDGRLSTGWQPADGDGLRKNDYSSLVIDELDRLVRHPLIGAIGARLAGVDAVRLWHDQLLYKPVEAPGRTVNVGWHTDRQYWRVCTSAEMLTAWVPFHDVTVEGGAVTFVDGSHRWADDVVLDFFNPDLDVLQQRLGDRRLDLVHAVLPKGAISFHHCRTLHGSGPNTGDAPRRALAIHLQPGDNRASGERDAQGEPVTHYNDVLARPDADGRPDYTDPYPFPVLFPPGQPLRADHRAG